MFEVCQCAGLACAAGWGDLGGILCAFALGSIYAKAPFCYDCTLSRQLMCSGDSRRFYAF